MKHLFLHIGAHKTGTSSVQRSFAANRALLASQGIHYLPGPANHSGVMMEAFGQNRLFRFHPGGTRIEGRAEHRRGELRDFLNSVPEGCFLISGEGMERFDAPAVQAMLGFFAPLVDRVTVVWFVRPPKSAVASIAQQRVKAGLNRSGLVMGSVHAYKAGVTYGSFVSKADFVVRLYDRAHLPRGCSIAALLEVMGAAPELYDRVQLRMSNEGLSRPAVAIFLAVNEDPAWKQGPPAQRRRCRHWLMHLLAQLPGERFTIPEAVIDQALSRPKVRKRMRKGLAWLERRLGARFAQPALPPPGAPSDSVTPEAWAEAELNNLTAKEIHALADLLQGQAELYRGAASKTADACVEVAGWLLGHLRTGPRADASVFHKAELAELSQRLAAVALSAPARPPAPAPRPSVAAQPRVDAPHREVPVLGQAAA